MRVVSWNVSGPSRKRAEGIADTLRRYDADIVLLSEVTERTPLFDRLHGAYPHQYRPEPGFKTRGAAILAKIPLHRELVPDSHLGARCVAASTNSITFVSLYGPSNWSDRPKLLAFWEAALQFVQPLAQRAAVIAGDFNLGFSLHDNQIGYTAAWGVCADPHYRKLLGAGFVDAWRTSNGETCREFSYYPRKTGMREPHGRRLDHFFVSPAVLPRVARCRYDHGVRQFEGAERKGDHSAMLLELTG